MDTFETIAAGQPGIVFDLWVDTLNRAGIQATQIAIADYDLKRGLDPTPHPRGNELHVLVPAERLEEALKILKTSAGPTPD